MPMEAMEGGHGQRGKTRALLPCIELELSEVLLKNIILETAAPDATAGAEKDQGRDDAEWSDHM